MMRSPARLGLVMLLSGWVTFTGLLIHGAYQASEARHQAVTSVSVMTPQPITVPLTDTVNVSVPSWRRLAPGQLWSLVNAQRSVAIDFVPSVTTVNMPTAAWYQQPQLTKPAARGLERWATAAEQAGYPMLITSAYRSGTDQQAVRDALTELHGAAYAEQFSARPGHSEHQLGLAVDVTRRTPACEQNFDNCQLDETMAKWLAMTAPQYGFILRYPPGREHITGVPAESWHFRFVGKELAVAVAASGLTLDEVVLKLESHRQAY